MTDYSGSVASARFFLKTGKGHRLVMASIVRHEQRHWPMGDRSPHRLDRQLHSMDRPLKAAKSQNLKSTPRKGEIDRSFELTVAKTVFGAACWPYLARRCTNCARNDSQFRNNCGLNGKGSTMPKPSNFTGGDCSLAWPKLLKVRNIGDTWMLQNIASQRAHAGPTQIGAAVACRGSGMS